MKLTKTKLKQIIKEELESISVELDEVLEKNIRAERLANGLYRFFDYKSRLSGLYKPDGSHQSGDLRLKRDLVQRKIAELPK